MDLSTGSWTPMTAPTDSPETRVFRALADPTRRAVLEMLREGERSVSELTAEFEMTQSAVSQHLKVLRDAELVSERKSGRNRLYGLEPGPIEEARRWLEEHLEFWTTRLEGLGAHLRRKHGPQD